MSINNFGYAEVRILQGSRFESIPNFTIATQELLDGSFAYLDSSGGYSQASSTNRASHLVLKSAVQRSTPEEIVDDMGKVLVGEPAMTVTGQGVVNIPVISNVTVGQKLVVGTGGYATGYTSGANYIVGQARETATLDGATVVWIDALITLPAEYKPA